MWRHYSFKFPKLFIVCRYSLYAKLFNPISGCRCCCFFFFFSFFQNNFSRLSLYSISIVGLSLAFSFWIIDLCRITLQWANIDKEMRIRVDNFLQINVFCPPEPRVGAFVYRNAGKVIRCWKVVIATLETYKICVPNNHINKPSAQRGTKQFQIREPQIKQTLAAQDSWVSACQKLNQYPIPKKPE